MKSTFSPIYQSIGRKVIETVTPPPNTNQETIELVPFSTPIHRNIPNETFETFPSSTPIHHHVLNPMYSSIDDLRIHKISKQSSEGIRRNSFSCNKAYHTTSTPSLIERTMSSGNGPAPAAIYSTIVPRYLRKKATRSMEVEDNVDVP